MRLTVGCHEYRARTFPTRMSFGLVLMLSVSSLSPLLAATRCSLHPNSLLVWHWLSYISPARSHPPLPPLFLSSLYVFALLSLTSLSARCVSVSSRNVGRSWQVSWLQCPHMGVCVCCWLRLNGVLAVAFYKCHLFNAIQIVWVVKQVSVVFLQTVDAIVIVSTAWDHEELMKE